MRRRLGLSLLGSLIGIAIVVALRLAGFDWVVTLIGVAAVVAVIAVLGAWALMPVLRRSR